MLYLHHGDDIQLLQQALLEKLSGSRQSVLKPDHVLVQNAGMKRWLQQAIARRCSVAANIEYPLPSRFVWDLYQALYDDQQGASTYDAEHLRWSLFRLLQLEEWADYSPLAAYVGQDEQGLAAFQLAEKMAEVFDRYQVYRPDMIGAWEKNTRLTDNPDEVWQARLWRQLREQRPEDHRSHKALRMIQRLRQGDVPAGRLPSRLYAFALSSLSPLYLQVFCALAQNIDVHVFVLNPTRHYWGDLLSRKERLRRGLEEEDENQLLASMGRQGRDFLEQFFELDPAPQEEEHFSNPGQGSLLEVLRHNILEFDQLPAPAEDPPSIRVVSAYSELRELQVLHDYLLQQLQLNPEWQPHDMVVMCPDINRLAPSIAAVFGQRSPAIPYSISDHAEVSASPLLRSVLEWIELAGSRFSASQVLGWLQVPAVQRAYQLDTQNVQAIAYWVENLHVHWGLNDKHRGQLGFSEESLNTWSHGIDRLLAGFIEAPRRETSLAAEINLTQNEFFALGQLQKLLDDLAGWQRLVAQPQPAWRWLQLVNRLIERSLQPDEEQLWQLRSVQDEIAAWRDQDAATGSATVISASVVGHLLRQSLQASTAQANYLNGAVNFCNLIPMRTLPFKCVCLVGMDHRSFPRGGVPTQLDLMAINPRRGDPSARDDDRYMFLQSILAARKAVFISYVGRNIRNDQLLQPSVVVSELMEYVEQTLGCKLEIEQTTLQPFSPDNYRRGSYARMWRSEPRMVEQNPDTSIEVPARDEIELAQLEAFFTNPARYFYQRCLAANLVSLQAEIGDDEHFELDQLQQYQLRSAMVEQLLQTHDIDRLSLLQSGLVLPGTAGQLQLQNSEDQAMRLVSAVRNDPFFKDRHQQDIQLIVDGSTLTGTVISLGDRGLLEYRPSSLKGKALFIHWLRHCLWCCVVESQGSCLYANDRLVRFDPLTQSTAQAVIRDVVAVYHEGLLRPLPFVANSSWDYVKKQQPNKSGKVMDSAVALAKVSDAWSGMYPPPEASDSYLQLAFPDGVPAAEDFPALAMRLFKPLLEYLQHAS
jgi:exodeoxyribonuclease V gamma subunit